VIFCASLAALDFLRLAVFDVITPFFAALSTTEKKSRSALAFFWASPPATAATTAFFALMTVLRTILFASRASSEVRIRFRALLV
jgi:hypothetical protein